MAPTTAPIENHLLGLLEDELEELRPRLERVSLDFRQVAFDVNERIEHAYFPEDGVVSIVGVFADGAAVEVATIGYEGMVGLPLFLGAERVFAQAFSQVPGPAYRIEADAFRAASEKGKLREVMELYTQALITQISQAGACNLLHLTEERFARWLLMTHDRVGKEHFTLTQDFMSQMLGVRRATVSQIAAAIQRQGIIDYSRGQVQILDRERLQGLTCECYGIMRAEFERLLGRPKRSGPTRAIAELPSFSRDGRSTAGDAAPRDARRGGDGQNGHESP